MVNLNNATNSKLVWVIGWGAVTAALVSWLLPKLSKPKPVSMVPAPTMATPAVVSPLPAVSPSAMKQSVGALRDYNLSGLAIEEIDDYPSTAGVMLSGV